MPQFFIYLVKVNIALLLFYSLYRLVLRRLTFYIANRLYLVFALVTSTLFPILQISGLPVAGPAAEQPVMLVRPDWDAMTLAVNNAGSNISVWGVLYLVYWIGVIVMLLLLAGSLFTVLRYYRASERQPEPSFHLRYTNRPAAAFTFWNMVFINPSGMSPSDLRAVVEHERVHARQMHGIDLLLAELNRVFYWFNPGAWLLKNAIRENLEFIADERAVSTGGDVKAYQYRLLHAVSGGNLPSGITSRFAFYQLKKRIFMMNKKRSGSAHRWRYLLLLPLLVLVLAVVARDRMKKSGGPQVPAVHPAAVTADTVPGKLPTEAEWKQAAWNQKNFIVYVRENGGRPLAVAVNRRGKTVATLLLSAGDKAVKAFEAKYGPVPPPPPPPANRNGTLLTDGSNEGTVLADKSGYRIYPDTLLWISRSDKDKLKSADAWKGVLDVLYVVDGVIVSQEDVFAIEGSRIARIDVLKGENGVKLYGEAGRNGVIKVTTKATITAKGDVVVMGTDISSVLATGYIVADTIVVNLPPAEPPAVTQADRQPQFNGSFNKFLQSNLRYPARAREAKIQGVVQVQFVVDQTGQVSDIQPAGILPGNMNYLYEEAKRIIALSSGHWKPAIAKGQPVKSYHSQTFNFVLP